MALERGEALPAAPHPNRRPTCRSNQAAPHACGAVSGLGASCGREWRKMGRETWFFGNAAPRRGPESLELDRSIPEFRAMKRPPGLIARKAALLPPAQPHRHLA